MNRIPLININKTKYGISFWFDRAYEYQPHHRKTIQFAWYGKYWDSPRVCYHSNGAKKGVDSCFDCTLIIGYLGIGYTNWSYSKNLTDE